jgi:chromatin remodeling complex protein RSC6
MSATNTSEISTKMSATAAKSTKKTAKATETPAPVAAVAAPVEAKVTKKAAKAAAPVATAAPVAAAAPAETTTTENKEDDIVTSFNASVSQLNEKIASFKSLYSEIATLGKTIEKQAARIVKKAERKGRKGKSPKAAGANPADCVFTKPVKVTDELCTFLGKAKGTTFSRSEVTKGIMAYAKSHNLMDKQTIKADASLRKLLTLSETDNLTILNLQKFLSRHYVKAAPVAA